MSNSAHLKAPQRKSVFKFDAPAHNETGGKFVKKGGNETGTTCKSAKICNVRAQPPSAGDSRFTVEKKCRPPIDKRCPSKIPVIGMKPKSVLPTALSSGTSRMPNEGTKVAPVKKTLPASTTGKYAKTSAVPPSTGLLPRKNSGISQNRSDSCDRVSDKDKHSVFEGQLLMLETVQTAFMQKLEALKGTIPGKVNREFKFVAIVQNEECKLVVHADYLKKLPKKLPVHAIADFKNQILDEFNGRLKAVHEQFKNTGALEEAHLVERLVQEQANLLSLFFDKVKNLFSATDTLEPYEVEYQNEMLDPKRIADGQEREISELKMANASQILEFDLEIGKKDDTIAELTRQIEELEKGQKTLQSATKEDTVEKGKQARLAEEINFLMENQTTLAKKLFQDGMADRITVNEFQEKNKEIAKLKKELDQSKKEDEEPLTIDEQRKKDYPAVEDNLIASPKELTDIQDVRPEVENSQALIKKLKQNLLDKDKELVLRPTGPQEYPAEMPYFLKFNQARELLDVRRDMIKTLRRIELEQRQRIKHLIAEDTEKRQKISELKIALQAKTNELQTALSTLESYKIKLSQNGAALKLLQENNVRSLILRNRQQEQIGSMELELCQMKQALAQQNASLPHVQ